MSRRSPLPLAFLALSLSCRTAAPERPEAPAARTPLAARIGVQTYSLRKQLDQDAGAALRYLRDQDVRELEIYHLMRKSPEELRAYLEGLGFSLRAMHIQYGRLEKDPEAVVAEARALGVQYASVPWIPHDKARGYTAEDNARAIALFNRVGPMFAAHGIRFLYHPHGYEFHDDGTGTPLMDQMIAQTQPGVVDFEMDIFWVVHAGKDPLDYLRRYPGRFRLFHIKDMAAGTETGRRDARADNDVAQVAAGTGIIDIPALIAEAERQGEPYYFVEDESARVLEQLPVSLAYLRGLAP